MKEVIGRKRRPCELHACLRHAMRLCRWSGSFLVEGLNDQYPEHVRFNLKSIYTVYFLITLIFACIRIGTSIEATFFKKNRINMGQAQNLILCLIYFATIVLLYRMAKKWPKLIRAATNIEHDLADVRTSGIRVKTTVLTYTIIMLAVFEHAAYIFFTLKLTSHCLGVNAINFHVFVKKFYRFVFDYATSNIWLGLLAEFIFLQGVFLRIIPDIIGMCFSIYFTSYFQDIGKIISSNQRKDWAKLRARYSRVVVLLNLVNDRLAPFILLSFFTNIFFICFQMFNSLNKHTLGFYLCNLFEHHLNDVVVGPEYQLFHLFSFTFMATRALLFSYLAVNVNTSAYNAVLTLYEVPASEYNEEVQCFQMQLHYTTIALNGIFFDVERKIILRVIATIITYELVLLQFRHSEEYIAVDTSSYNYTKAIVLNNN